MTIQNHTSKPDIVRLIHVAGLAAALVMGGCSGAHHKAGTTEGADKDPAPAQEEPIEAPSWATQPPETDGATGVGQARASNRDDALRMAEMKAKMALARQIHQSLSGRERYSRHQTDNTKDSDLELTVERIVEAVPMDPDPLVENQKLIDDQGKFYAYVLLRMDKQRLNELVRKREQVLTEAGIEDVVEVD